MLFHWSKNQECVPQLLSTLMHGSSFSSSVLENVTMGQSFVKSIIWFGTNKGHDRGSPTGYTKESASHVVNTRVTYTLTGFPLDLENLEKWGYTWKTWKYHGILKNLINIMEKWHETWKNLMATENSPLTPLKQCKIHKITEVERKVY